MLSSFRVVEAVTAALLVVHVAFGMVGLVIGPLAMWAPKRRGRHTQLGLWYQAATFGLCTTAIGLVFINPSVWPLAIIAVGTELAALAGWQVQRRRRRGWLRPHISLMCGSYVSFVTAFLVVNLDGALVAWTLPTVVATPLIARAAARARRNDRSPTDATSRTEKGAPARSHDHAQSRQLR